MIYRHAKYGKSGKPRHCGPNTTLWCIECQGVQPVGYEIRDQVTLGSTSIFICDTCLNQAKSGGKYGHKLIDHYSES